MSYKNQHWWVSDYDLARICIAVFPVNRDIAMAVALAESGGDAWAWNTAGEDSRGLWQINVAWNANPKYASWDFWGAWGPVLNALAALEISSGGTYWCPWSVFEEECGPGHTGDYRTYLDRARAAIAAALYQPPVPVPDLPPAPLPSYSPPYYVPSVIVYPVYPESALPYAFMFGALVLYGMYVHSFVSKKKLLLKYRH
jgi:hypothetical protein